MAKRKHEPSEFSRRQVREMVGTGLLDGDIARCMQITEKQLTHYYQPELARGSPEKILHVARTMYSIATDPLNKGCVEAAKYWLERRGGEQWRKPPDRVENEVRVQERPVIDSSKLSAEQRAQLKEILLALEAPKTIANQPKLLAAS